MVKMAGVFSKRKYYREKEEENENGEELSEEDDDNDDIIENHNIFSCSLFIVLDTDTTSFKRKNCRLIAIHAVEVKDGKLTGTFFILLLIKETKIMILCII